MTDVFTGEFYQIFKKEITPIFCNLFLRRETEGIFFLWDQHYPKTKITQTLQERKTADQYLSWIYKCKTPQQNISKLNSIIKKRNIQHNQVEFIPCMQGWFNIWKPINVIYHIKKKKKKNHMIILIGSEKAFDKNLTPIHYKNSQQTRNRVGISSAW